VEAVCEKRIAEAERSIKMFEKQRQEFEGKEKELQNLKQLYRIYMNEQIPHPSQENSNANYRMDRGGHWLFWLA